ncbi:MAG: hypothetical protein M1156_00775, partial [Candidatus Marsarchaeota archaeon]|nr:hypothetical protein [Candidatus Marsarchaeota archaeon]
YNGLRVVYLLEENTWKTYLTLFTEKELAIGRAVHIGLMHEAGIIGRMEVVSLENKAYELNLECDYFHDIGIGENTEAVIKGRNIGVAILNLGNAEAIVDRNKIGRDGTLIVQSYAAEAIPEIATVQSVGMQSIQTTLVRDAVPNIQELMRDDRLRVGYKALKTGRITDENPDFIGTWDIRIPPRGLFELFIEKRDGGRIAGRIEDTIGSAKFSGVSAEGRIDFVKQYMESAVDIGGIPDRIEYSGVVRRRSDVTGTFVTGTFVSADAVNIGQFTMSEFKNEKR